MRPRELAYEPQDYKDPETGRRVTRLFPEGRAASHAYFTSTSYDSQGRLILTEKIDGNWQIVRMDRRAGTLHQLTDAEDLSSHVYCVCPATDTVVAAQDGKRLVALDMDSLELREMFRAPEGFRLALPTMDNEGRRVAFSVQECIPGFTRSAQIYSTMAENYFFRPRCMVVTVDMADGRAQVAWGEQEWISHVLINPTDPDVIVFCHEGGLLVDHRLWVVDCSVRHKRRARPLYEETEREFMVHEFFLPDGILGVQHTVFDGDNPERDWRRCTEYAKFLDMNGNIVQDVRLPGMRAMHLQSRADRSFIVGDGCFPEPGGDYEPGNSTMALIRPRGGTASVEPLCRHDSKMDSQLAHPHPIFSPDGRQVLFNSVRAETASPYVVEVNR